VKIRWREFVSRLSELESSEFVKTRMGVVTRQSMVVRASSGKGGDVMIALQCGKEYLFPNAITWARLLSDGNIVLKREEGDPPGTSFLFRLQAPFKMPERTEEEQTLLRELVLSRLGS
jgi:hypothetical protein